MRRVAAAALIVGAGAGLFGNRVLIGVSTFMAVRDPLERADLIVVLYHEGVVAAAADLYRRGYGERVAIGRLRSGRLITLGVTPPQHEVWRRLLEARGIPPRDILILGRDLEHDRDLGRVVAAHLASREKSRVILVVTAPMSRVIRDEFRRGLGGAPVDVRMYPVPSRRYDDRVWWQSRHGVIAYFDAYALWAIRLLRD